MRTQSPKPQDALTRTQADSRAADDRTAAELLLERFDQLGRRLEEVAMQVAAVGHPGTDIRDRLLSLQESAERLGISKRAFLDLVARRGIRTTRIGRRRLVSERFLDAFIRANTR